MWDVVPDDLYKTKKPSTLYHVEVLKETCDDPKIGVPPPADNVNERFAYNM